MEIIVEGKGKVQYAPEVIKVNVVYDFVEKFYDKALKTGTESFNEFVEGVLPKLNLERKDLKTNTFNIERVVEEDAVINKRVTGHVYNFRQEASFELDYSNENIEIFMTEIIKLNK